MATPLPDGQMPAPTGSTAVLRGVVLGAVALGVLAVAAWLGLREPAPPGVPAQQARVEAPLAAVPGPVAAPAPAVAPSSLPIASAPPAGGPPVSAPVAAAPVPAAPVPAAPIQAAPVPAAPVPAIPAPAAAPASATSAAATAEPPRFDIVRVNPQGGAVIAGRAAPGSEVILRSNGHEIGRTRADAQGQWVLVGAAPLAPGTHEITVASRDASGREIAGAATVLAEVAARTAPVASASPAAPGAASAPPAAAPLVVLTTPQGAPTLLQGPSLSQGVARAAGPARLGLDLVDYDDAGEIRFAGTAPAGALVRVYVDDGFVGEVAAGADGRWALVPGSRVAQGEHRLRLDQMDPAGRVVAARIAQPFQRAAVAAAAAGDQRVVVQPRQNLWRIARQAYGQGVRYTEIFAANRDVISDPSRIYPGQVFTVPVRP